MNNSRSVLTTLLFLCLISEASAQFNQYTFMRRGQVSAYDSSVNIQIQEYRKIRQKLTLVDTLLQELAIERFQNSQLVKEQMSRLATEEEIAARHYATVAEKDATIYELRKVNTEAIGLAKKLQIFPNPVLDFTSKVGGGVLIGLIISLIVK